MMKMNFFYLVSAFGRILESALIIATISFPMVSYAQIEEIVVTAQKRTESVQEVPIAMQAFTGEQLNRR